MVKKHLKITIYSGDIPSTTFIERLIRGIADSRHTVLLFGTLKQRIEYGDGVFVYGYHPQKISKLWSLVKYGCLLFFFKYRQKRQLDAYLATEKKNDLYTKVKFYPVLWAQPDVFHLQWVKGLDDWMWVQDFGMKLVVSLRGAHINYSPIADLELATMYRQNFPKVDAFHAVSEAIALEATKYGADFERITVVKSGLNGNDFPFELKTEIPKGKLSIVSVGRDHWIKNYRMSMDVMSVLKRKNVSFHYNIIGIDDSEALLFQRCQLQLEHDVSFIRTLSFQEAQTAIKNADILLMPSLKEGIANVVLEAMLLGTLVISTDCGGMAELVIPNQTGYLVPNREVDAMASAIAKVTKLTLKDYQTMLLEARAFVEQHHSRDGMVADMLALYTTITANNS